MVSLKVELRNINKSFGNLQVLKNARIKVGEGEVHGLLGENGAGKSTLMNILTGVYSKDSGQILIDGKEQHFTSIKDSEHAGIAFIHQELNVLNNMSIVDNMFLGREIKNKFGFLDKNQMSKIVKETISLLGMDIDPHTLIQDIPVGQRQLIEISKALLLDAKLIIMDEPTASLTDKEINLLFEIINNLREEQGVSFIYISHRLEEIFEICDKVTIMRDGKFISESNISDLTFDDIVSQMVGYDLDDRFPRIEAEPQEVILKVNNLTKDSKYYDISFDLRKGEVLGFYGLMGAGRTDVMHGLFGSVLPDSGEVEINGKSVDIKNPMIAKELGLGFITEDRQNEGLILDFPISENFILPSLEKIIKKLLVHRPTVNDLVDNYIKKLQIRTSSRDQYAMNLSGGNQQKVVIGKWLATSPQILILDEPTRGVDVGAKREIYYLINDLKKEGVAIIFVSSELPEILGVSDRIVVMREKRISKIIDHKHATQEKIMEYSTRGVK